MWLDITGLTLAFFQTAIFSRCTSNLFVMITCQQWNLPLVAHCVSQGAIHRPRTGNGHNATVFYCRQLSTRHGRAGDLVTAEVAVRLAQTEIARARQVVTFHTFVQRLATKRVRVRCTREELACEQSMARSVISMESTEFSRCA